ncbi:hypothetical protein B0I35DRAFT_446241 [Stachybotrys elegans]|uniref:Uncharacterized protein n=1 Tax=Stachybotrys elegans TaxID=80388 RepID=A0A8K0WKU3_9HYPO|nr:hypothetical protein B0I35DRAFT_446241 [Stachybotrys elegans]
MGRLHIISTILWLACAGVTMSQLSSSSTKACFDSCSIAFDRRGISVYLWYPTYPNPSWGWVRPTVTATLTVATSIDRESDETKTITQLPPAVTQATNSDGTAIRTIEYIRFERTLTTVVTYPEIFIDWPDYIGSSGTYKTTDRYGNPECRTISYDQMSRVYLPNPQPSAVNERNSIYSSLFADDFSTFNDTTGLSYFPGLLVDTESPTLFPEANQSWFPQADAFSNCRAPIGPHFAGFVDTYWVTATSTSNARGPNSIPEDSVSRTSSGGSTEGTESVARIPVVTTLTTTSTVTYSESTNTQDGSVVPIVSTLTLISVTTAVVQDTTSRDSAVETESSEDRDDSGTVGKGITVTVLGWLPVIWLAYEVFL